MWGCFINQVPFVPDEQNERNRKRGKSDVAKLWVLIFPMKTFSFFSPRNISRSICDSNVLPVLLVLLFVGLGRCRIVLSGCKRYTTIIFAQGCREETRRQYKRLAEVIAQTPST